MNENITYNISGTEDAVANMLLAFPELTLLIQDPSSKSDVNVKIPTFLHEGDYDDKLYEYCDDHQLECKLI
jgi:hypothetical protein